MSEETYMENGFNGPKYGRAKRDERYNWAIYDGSDVSGYYGKVRKIDNTWDVIMVVQSMIVLKGVKGMERHVMGLEEVRKLECEIEGKINSQWECIWRWTLLKEKNYLPQGWGNFCLNWREKFANQIKSTFGSLVVINTTTV